MEDKCIVHQLGVLGYQPALELQQRIHRQVADGERPGTILLLEHPHVYTLGRRGVTRDIFLDSAELKKLQAELYHTDRGGQVTYHGPGQLVGYPILDLRRWGAGPLAYVHALEEAIVGSLDHFGLTASSDQYPTGVWIGDAKIAAIGVKISRGVSMHGFAINVDPDLSYFDHIVPCGMPKANVTSVSRELGSTVSIDQVVSVLTSEFGRVFGMQMIRQWDPIDAPVTVDTSSGR
ncbi:lipoyl(octanoyl) transferase LipB [Dehalococcoidia bacterium]|nr:lipoyl(octanoyl) transferase LipB [Dehalococcoidia bacterium]